MPSRQGVQGAQANAITPFQLGAIHIFVYGADPSSVVTALSIGDICIDNVNGNLYIAGATGTGHWDAITHA